MKIRRDEGPLFQISDAYTRVCSRHFNTEDFYAGFASGRRELKPGSIPSIFPWTNESLFRRKAPKERQVSEKHHKDRKKLSAEITQVEDVSASGLLHTITSEELFGSGEGEEPCEIGEITSSGNVSSTSDNVTVSLLSRVRELEAKARYMQIALQDKKKEMEKLQHINMDIKSKLVASGQALKDGTFTYANVKKDNKLLQFYTGFTCSSDFESFFEFINCGENGENVRLTEAHVRDPKGSAKRRNRKLSGRDQLLLVLCRLKVGLYEQDLAFRFSISQGTVSKILVSWINFLYIQLGRLVLWPSRQYVDRNMPDDFKAEYPTTRVVIDATEIQCQVPSSFLNKTVSYSSYKSRQTKKGLIGIAPNGIVTFVSELYDGSISDVELAKRCGILKMPYDDGDSIMADKGFRIQTDLPSCVSLNIPPFLQNDGQFAASDVIETQKIARLRIHVERLIMRIKCYGILRETIPVNLVPVLNQMWTVCAIMTVFMNPIISSSGE